MASARTALFCAIFRRLLFLVHVRLWFDFLLQDRVDHLYFTHAHKYVSFLAKGQFEISTMSARVVV